MERVRQPGAVFDPGVVLGNRQEEHGDVLQLELLLEEDAVAGMQDSETVEIDHISAVIETGLLEYAAVAIPMDGMDRVDRHPLQAQLPARYGFNPPVWRDAQLVGDLEAGAREHEAGAGLLQQNPRSYPAEMITVSMGDQCVAESREIRGAQGPLVADIH